MIKIQDLTIKLTVYEKNYQYFLHQSGFNLA